MFVDDWRQHLGHGAVITFRDPVAIGVERASRDLADLEAPVHRLRELQAKPQPIVGKQSRWAAPQGDAFDDNIGRIPSPANSAAMTPYTSAPAAKAVREQRIVSVPEWRNGEGTEIIDGDDLAEAVGQ